MIKTSMLCCLMVLLYSQFSFANEEKLNFGIFDTVTLYYTPDHIENVVLFISGDEGWNGVVEKMALELSHMNTLVVGVNNAAYLRHLKIKESKCTYPAGNFEYLSKYVQKKLNLQKYKTPIIIGFSSGAALAYALLAQAPSGTFKSALSINFCPDVFLNKPFCEGFGLQSVPMANGKGYSLLPIKALTEKWVVLQESNKQNCSVGIETFTEKVGNSHLIMLQGIGREFSTDEKNWLPQFKDAYNQTIEIKAETPNTIDTCITGLPLSEVPSSITKENDCFAILLTGDGGWAGIDKSIAKALSENGIPVVGFNTLQYFWTARTPEEASNDLSRVINHYKKAWKKSSTILVGYSFGADVLPFLADRMNSSILDHTKLIAFLGLSEKTSFQFYLTDWLGTGADHETMLVIPEMEKLKNRKMLVFYGEDEKGTPIEKIPQGLCRIVKMPGGHHFNGKYDLIADEILKNAFESK